MSKSSQEKISRKGKERKKERKKIQKGKVCYQIKDDITSNRMFVIKKNDLSKSLKCLS